MNLKEHKKRLLKIKKNKEFVVRYFKEKCGRYPDAEDFLFLSLFDYILKRKNKVVSK